jgi:xylan 1,4-beta-xylosidase
MLILYQLITNPNCNSVKKVKLFFLLIVLVIANGVQGQTIDNNKNNRLITVDIDQVKGNLNKSYNFCVGAGRANEGLRADWQWQLRLAKQECGFRYIRFHGLLTDDMGVYHEDKAGNPIYNWQYIDELFDFLQNIDVKPFVELSFMPTELASGNKTIFWWRGNVTPPKDYKKWDDLISHLVNHWKERYGDAEIQKWYFEVWNEPNLSGFFTGSQDDYFKLYSETAKTIKSVSAKYKVGGPATAGNAWIPEMIDFCAKNQVPIDFISTHTYGVKQGFLDATGNAGTVLSQDKASVYSDMIHSAEQIKHSAMPGLELHYTEWSASYTPSDPIHDSYHEAAYILDKIKHASPYVNSMSYWTFTDIFEEAGPRFTPFHGGFGLLNYQDIKKPAFYAYRFLNQLGNIELKEPDEASIVTKNKNGNVQLLFWNFTITHPGDSVNDQVYYKRNLPSKSISPAQINIKNLGAGTYKLEVYKVGYRSNDAYTVYYDMKSPSQLTKQQVSAIKQAADGKPIATSIIKITSRGELKRMFPMRENDVYFISLKKI